MRRLLSTVALAVALAVPSFAQTTAWEIDPVHSNAQFSVRHLMISNVRGEFSKVTGVIQLDEKDISKSTVEVTIDATTIDTREPKRDAHLKSPDFLDAATYPTMTFKSKKIARAADGKLKLTGDLTVRAVTR